MTSEYRYKLKRENISDGHHFGALLYIMLNPSTANESIDDRTIESCTRLAKNNGYDRFMVGNLYAYISTDPKKLGHLTLAEAQGEKNNQSIKEMLHLADSVVVAWGLKGGRNGTPDIYEILKNHKLLCIDTNLAGSPVHPLYQSSTTKFQEWNFEKR